MNMNFPATDRLRSDHRAMERLLEGFESDLSNPHGEGLVALARTFAEIQRHLAAHFIEEEEIFYPALEPKLAAADPMFAKLKDDHTNVRETSAAIQELLDQARHGSDLPLSQSAELASLGWVLWNQIHHHIDEEEKGLLAFADRTLDSNAQTRLAAQMEDRSVGMPKSEFRLSSL
jgi:hemerythrin-like domain-containing protein